MTYTNGLNILPLFNGSKVVAYNEGFLCVYPTNFFEVYDDFVSPINNWNQNTGNGGSTNYQTQSPSGRPGIWKGTTGTSGTGYATIQSFEQNFNLSGGQFYFETSINIPVLSTSGNRFTVLAGFCDSYQGTEGNNGIFFLYTDATDGGNWQAITYASDVTTSTNTGVAAVTGWTKLGILINATATSVGYYINGTLVATNTTNIPTADCGCVVWVAQSAGSTSVTLESDYFWIYQFLTNTR